MSFIFRAQVHPFQNTKDVISLLKESIKLHQEEQIPSLEENDSTGAVMMKVDGFGISLLDPLTEVSSVQYR